jgi:hypothetical protein
MRKFEFGDFNPDGMVLEDVKAWGEYLHDVGPAAWEGRAA